MIKDIINTNLERIENDLFEIEGLQTIDFIDIFPKNEEHIKQLDEIHTNFNKAQGLFLDKLGQPKKKALTKT